MQRVTNCVLQSDNQILMLKKPRRNWYAAPGGKMEPGENIKQAVKREFKEETDLTLVDPELKGVFTFVIQEDGETVKEWMMFTFACKKYEGKLTDYCREGELEWVPFQDVLTKDMAEGDKTIFDHCMNRDEVLYGTFTYTSDYQLLSLQLD
ncbi:NUDIX hydrolase [Salinibacillus xinjiangensis]|uniref:NUDIX domain-containing protein n=1 Tax=Salinibacillus xinjiangensis TaxID=1229268 RepID=A0A6G1X199_9BACI|nr:8-oxo-dGTP diphosphatase [Salinibacillus xinjiangensis]MRG84732.1 NUDIX domain-containing protein [Salinibacillus xinjiangensis]